MSAGRTHKTPDLDKDNQIPSLPKTATALPPPPEALRKPAIITEPAPGAEPKEPAEGGDAILPPVPMVDHLKTVGQLEAMTLKYEKAVRIIDRMKMQVGQNAASLAEEQETNAELKLALDARGVALQAAVVELNKLREEKGLNGG